MIQLADAALNALRWTLELSADHNRVNESLAARIGAISGLKTFPVVAQKVISLLHKSDFTIDEITDTIRQDPSLAAGVLRLANSPFYMATHPITSLDLAFIRLGRNTVREVIFAVATMQLFPDTHGLGRLIRDHCACVAAIAHVLASRLRIGTPEVMFLAGLMHDIGIMLLIDSGEVLYSFSKDDALVNPACFRDTELEQVGFDHSILGAQVLSRWKVGAPVPQLVAYHHLPALAEQTPEISSMVSLLRLADTIEVHLGTAGTDGADFVASQSCQRECRLLGMDIGQLLKLWPELEAVRKQSIQLFS
ncbi:MAG: HDOD domain-containing protein [Deltaproteobacteria bacterium]|nr:HDOD domain-containing protein [Deltaproteobacteria bacterium]